MKQQVIWFAKRIIRHAIYGIPIGICVCIALDLVFDLGSDDLWEVGVIGAFIGMAATPVISSIWLAIRWAFSR